MNTSIPHTCHGLIVAGLMLTAFHAQAGTQTTVLRAPVTAVAIGTGRATAEVNTYAPASSGGRHTVVVRRPVLAVGLPGRPAHVRVN